MNPNNSFDSATEYLSSLDAAKAAYSVAVVLVASTAVLYLFKKSGFRAMVAVGS